MKIGDGIVNCRKDGNKYKGAWNASVGVHPAGMRIGQPNGIKI